MKTYFNINYEFDKQEVHRAIEVAQKGYICVAGNMISVYNECAVYYMPN